MCVVSMVGDHYTDKWQPWNQKIDNSGLNNYFNNVSRKEFDDLKKEVIDMKELLIKAKEYDKINNEPNCEIEGKVELLKKIADLVGVDLKEIFN